MSEAKLQIGISAHNSASPVLHEVSEHVGGLGESLKHMGEVAGGLVIGDLFEKMGGSIAGAFEKGIEQGQEFGQTVLKLQRETGGSAEAVSGMVAAMERFGLSGDDASKS